MEKAKFFFFISAPTLPIANGNVNTLSNIPTDESRKKILYFISRRDARVQQRNTNSFIGAGDGVYAVWAWATQSIGVGDRQNSIKWNEVKKCLKDGWHLKAVSLFFSLTLSTAVAGGAAADDVEQFDRIYRILHSKRTHRGKRNSK